MSELDKLHQTAFNLYDMGLNIFPMPSNLKSRYESFPFQFLVEERVYRDDIPELFKKPYPIGIHAGNRRPPYFFFIKCQGKNTYTKLLENIQQEGLNVWVSQREQTYYFWFMSQYGRIENQDNPKSPIQIYGNYSYLIAPSPANHAPQWLIQQGDQIPSIHIDHHLLHLNLEREAPRHTPITYESRHIRHRYRVYRSEAVATYLEFHHHWQDKNGLNDFRVLCGIFYLIQKSKQERIVFRATIREIATYAHLNKKTVNQSLKRLIKQGILINKGKDKSNGYQYKLSDEINKKGRQYIKKQGRNGTLRATIIDIYLLFYKNPLLAAILEPEALGWEGLYLYHLLKHPQYRTRKDLATRSGFTYDLVKRRINNLIQYELINEQLTPTELLPDKLYRIIKQTNADQHTQRRKDEYTKDRQQANSDRILYWFKNYRN